MRVITCLFADHNLWLVALAAAVCVSGCWVTFRLLERALKSGGALQRAGWLFQTGVAAGSSVWCTHFVAVLAYDAKAPVFFDPLLTAVSLVIAIAGLGLGFAAALQLRYRFAPELGGVIAGVAIPAMHYTGMAAYHIDGIVEWSVPYIIASVAA
jgi:NO-binding membrane sensor protein with MHYT domain